MKSIDILAEIIMDNLYPTVEVPYRDLTSWATIKFFTIQRNLRDEIIRYKK